MRLLPTLFAAPFLLVSATALAQQQAGLVGAVVDPRGDGVAGATVFAQGAGGGAADLTDPNGNFFVLLPAAGAYRLTVTHPGYLPGKPQTVPLIAGRRNFIRIRLSPAVPIEPILLGRKKKPRG